MPAALVEPLRTWLAEFPAGERVFARIAGGTARMPRSDLKAGRRAWLDAAADESERKQREEDDFLKYADHQGEVADFHAIRVIYVARVTAAGASVKGCPDAREALVARPDHERLRPHFAPGHGSSRQGAW